MDKYTDDKWLDSIARQYEIAMEAQCDLEDVVADDLGRRTGASVMRVQQALYLTDGPDDGRPWLRDVIALNQQLRALMGDEYDAVRTRLELLGKVAESCGEAVARHRHVERDDGHGLLGAYTDDPEKGSEGFAAWLGKVDAEEEETNSRIDAAAEADDADELARHLIVERPQAISLLAAFKAEPQSETFATWAWRHLQMTEAAAE
jgi:hypothetical protein